MIDDMASLKQAMEQMDADDAIVAQADKDRAAQILSGAGLSFSKLAEAIEEQRLLLRPKIVASIKRMDQPASLGDAAFRDTGASLRKEGQSFRQIAEALELHREPAPRRAPPVHAGLVTQLDDEPDGPEEKPGLPLILRVLLYPFRHPLQILAIAVLTVMLANVVHEFEWSDRLKDGRRAGDTVARRLAEATPSSSNTVPVNSSADQSSSSSPSTPPADKAASSATEPAPAANPSAPTPPRTDAKSSDAKSSDAKSPDVRSSDVRSADRSADARSNSPSNSATNDRARTLRSRSLDDYMPERLRRSSRVAGPCRAGVGGCYWGGGQY
jgi:hypothetical protein